MANITTHATIDLNINGAKVQQQLEELKKRASDLRKKFDECIIKGDNKGAQRLQKQIESIEARSKKFQERLVDVNRTLNNLDKASLGDLNKALRTLQANIQKIERGTKAWDQHVAAIQKVKQKINEANAAMAVQSANARKSTSAFSRFNAVLNNCQTFIMGLIGAISGLVMAGRKSVNNFASMEEQMANTRKFTRMTAEDVEKINEMFKSFDTRIAREQLNLLAQEGGRLGYNTVKNVREYVEAASIINVALVDLGEGATQTIAKLSNIFGIEKMYGVRDAMLKVGSTVNHLSQNCTAAKPFIVEFAQRLAGVGSVAKMSIPDIMAFAATLDAHGQKVEMSATALQRVIVELYKSPMEMAQKVGLNAKQFTKVIMKDTTQGVIMFLEALHRLGEKDALAVLAPLFEDLGLDGQRVTAVLANLSSHIDFLKWQLGEANKAFKEGTSASNEYAIFNNTVQAAIDKAKNRVKELSIELGQKLYPVMKHVYTSSSVFLRVLNVIVSALVALRVPLTILIGLYATYAIRIGIVKAAHAALLLVMKAGNAAFIRGSVTLSMFRRSLILTAANARRTGLAIRGLNLAIEIMNKIMTNKLMMISFAGTIGMIAAMIATVRKEMDKFAEVTREAMQKIVDFDKATMKEMEHLSEMFSILKRASEGTQIYEDTKASLIRQYGKYLANLIDEKGQITDLAAAYDRLTEAVKRSMKARAIKEAREMLENDYYEELKTKLDDLVKNLVASGMDSGEALTIKYDVYTSLATGTPVPQNVIDKINGSQSNSEFWTRLSKSLDPLFDFVGIDKGYKFPVDIMNSIYKLDSDFKTANKAIDDMENDMTPYRQHSTQNIEWAIESLKSVIKEAEEEEKKQGLKGNKIAQFESNNTQSSALVLDIQGAGAGYQPITVHSARQLLNTYENELAIRQFATDRNKESDGVSGDKDFSDGKYTQYSSVGGSGSNNNVDKFAAEKQWKERAEAKAKISYYTGISNYVEFTKRMDNISIGYYKRMLRHTDIGETERLKLEAQLAEARKKRNDHKRADSLKHENEMNDKMLADLKQMYADGIIDKKEYDQAIVEQEIMHQKEVIRYTEEGTKERIDAERKLQDIAIQDKLKKREQFEKLIEQYSKEYRLKSLKEQMAEELRILDEMLKQKLINQSEYEQMAEAIRKKAASGYIPKSAEPDKPESAQKEDDIAKIKEAYDAKLMTEEEYLKAKDNIEKYYFEKQMEHARSSGNEFSKMVIDIYSSFSTLFGEGFEGMNISQKIGSIAKAAEATFAVVNACMQSYMEYSKACTDLEVARIEKRYDAEIALAEGNVYKKKQAEKKKEKEVAKIKAEAAKKTFALQVIQAVAQTAIAALNAYSSAAAIPVVGTVLAPIAAATAIAAGMMQVATLKKQQQAAEAQGYMEGGFTPQGDRGKEVGVVHAGEWVAPKKLVDSPRTRPLINLLEHARKFDRLPAISYDDVSAISPAGVAVQAARAEMSGAPAAMAGMASAFSTASETDSRIADTLSRLNDRLDEPFVTVNTVTGDAGIKKAQDDYNRLMKNKSR